MHALRRFAREHSLSLGLALMFALTSPIDLAHAGVLSIDVPFVLYLVLGWGFVIAAVAMTAFTEGRSATTTLLGRYQIGRAHV